MNKKGFANIVLIILAVLLIGVVGYFELAKRSVPEPVSNVISNWKTYTNDNYGFGFSYPSIYTTKIFDKLETPGALFEINIVGPAKTSKFDSPTTISIDVWSNSKQLSLLDWVKTNSSFSNYNSDSSNTDFKDETLAGHKAISYLWQGQDENGRTVVIDNNQTILLLNIGVNSHTDQLWQDFDKILPTFKFTK